MDAWIEDRPGLFCGRVPCSSSCQRAEHEHDVLPETSFLNVAGIGLRESLRRRHVNSLKLGQSGYAGPHGKHLEFTSCDDDVMLRWEAWARTDEAHFTAQDVDQLRQFVELVSAQLSAERCDPGGSRIMRADVRRTCCHRPELDANKWYLTPTNALLKKQSAARRRSAYQDHKDEQNRRENDKAEARGADIKQSLQRPVKAVDHRDIRVPVSKIHAQRFSTSASVQFAYQKAASSPIARAYAKCPLPTSR